MGSLARRGRTALLSGLVFVSVGALGLAKLAAPFDADAPAHVSVRSYEDDGQVRTLLFAPDGAPSELAQGFPLQESAWPWSRERATASAADGRVATEPPPTLEVVSRTVAPPQNHIVAKLRSARGASIVGIAVRPGDDIREVSLHGEALVAPEAVSHREVPWSFYECVTTPPDGIDVELSAPMGQSAFVYVFDRKPGLLEGAPSELASARGAAAVPYGAGDYSVVARRITLP